MPSQEAPVPNSPSLNLLKYHEAVERKARVVRVKYRRGGRESDGPARGKQRPFCLGFGDTDGADKGSVHDTAVSQP